MTDQQLQQLGISVHEMQALHHLWNAIAPCESNGFDCRCAEQRWWNANHVSTPEEASEWYDEPDYEPRRGYGAWMLNLAETHEGRTRR